MKRLVAVNVPYAGLGNRLRFTLSAQMVAEAEGRAFSYVWPTGPDFGAELTDLWAFDAEEVDDPTPGGPYLTHTDDLGTLRGRDEWVIKSAYIMPTVGDAWEARLAALPLAPGLADQVRQVRDSLGGPYVGVQVRTSAKTHARTLEASPVSWFADRMAAMLDDDPATRFFISADMPRARADLLGRFPTATALPVPEGYNSVAGIRKAVVDLAVLSRSTHLLGSHWSSFIETAWALGGRRQDLETSQSVRKGRQYETYSACRFT